MLLVAATAAVDCRKVRRVKPGFTNFESNVVSLFGAGILRRQLLSETLPKAPCLGPRRFLENQFAQIDTFPKVSLGDTADSDVKSGPLCRYWFK